MINKRLLIKNLIAHHTENSFFDKKQQLNLHTLEGKAKFLKHVCSLSNSNPTNQSFILVGIEDERNTIMGVDFYDDSHIQNLINAYLENPPQIQYDNVVFPHLKNGMVVGLVTIFPKKGKSYFKKRIYTIEEGFSFSRIGSISHPQYLTPQVNNEAIVDSIQKASVTNLKNTIDSVLQFITKTHPDMKPKYQVFKEYFTLCWAGIEKIKKGETYLSRVDIELINEQVKLFYSALDEVSITYNENEFVITEYVKIGFRKNNRYIPFSIQKIIFNDEMTYQITSEIVFKTPYIDKKHLHHLYNYYVSLLDKLSNNRKLTETEQNDLQNLCYSLMLCYLHGFQHAKDLLINHKEVFKNAKFTFLYTSFKEVMRILRKLKYETQND
ncbi:ATP-binding protein [Flavobacterium sp. xlx-214]|uniref:DUF5929 domain-containing protein n=1 Tax=unclassified Flavobacterium TaxID=196869 RepID=UPI0013D1820A|nr:DUF5929 domain-containing protein [Flavobacterium sp. xlx-214]MBA5793644.1 ATP-binding protein [Flavobacterium sp. xlx-221]QMI84936.1 ATP-binding protein [Flavobacterium sp. xlx-214]